LSIWDKLRWSKRLNLPSETKLNTPASATANQLASQLRRLSTPAVAVFLAFVVAELSILYIRDQFLPTSAPPSTPVQARQATTRPRSSYNIITQRNIFDSDGVIPDALSVSEQQELLDGPAVPTTLPINLVGTIVHINPLRSVATVEIKSAGNKVLPYFVGEEIESLATITKIERKKVTFRNRQTGRLEYSEIKDEFAVKFGAAPKKAASEGIEQQGNQVTVERKVVEDALKDLPNILQQASAVPNFIPGSGGQIDGFRLVQIQDGSIFSQLGLKQGDVINEVNGEVIDSITKAMATFKDLKTSNKITVQVNRGGTPTELTFYVR